jgi:hypothetical protein
VNTRTVSCCAPVCDRDDEGDDAGAAFVDEEEDVCGAVCAGQTSAAEQMSSNGHDFGGERLGFMPV